MRDEKFDEKDMEKRDEKDEKDSYEKWRRDPLSAVTWAVILIWAGLALLAENVGILGQFTRRFADTPGLQFLEGLTAWSIILIGAGLILLIAILVRMAVPAYRGPVTGTLFLALLLIGLGLGNVLGWNIVWPLILIGFGLSVLLRGLWRER
ncbi:MAG: hypothetical protein EHM70_16090 [Chloroflexota bacterium]|nr:MAG: hypothetical protein EHM70_16090 [Chloroflexota bacterium]